MMPITNHPHFTSGSSAMASGAAFFGTTIATNIQTFSQTTGSWLTDENVKWSLSMAFSVVFGAFSIYRFVMESLEQSRLKRAKMQADAAIEIEEEKAAAKRRADLADFEQRVTLRKIASKLDVHAEAIEAKVDVAQTTINAIAEKVDAVVGASDVTAK